MFFGKIGVWALAERYGAKRSSKWRPRVTKELKPVNVQKDTYRDINFNNVIPLKRKSGRFENARHQYIYNRTMHQCTFRLMMKRLLKVETRMDGTYT